MFHKILMENLPTGVAKQFTQVLIRSQLCHIGCFGSKVGCEGKDMLDVDLTDWPVSKHQSSIDLLRKRAMKQLRSSIESLLALLIINEEHELGLY